VRSNQQPITDLEEINRPSELIGNFTMASVHADISSVIGKFKKANFITQASQEP
jgi:hypothetical protein